MSMMSSTPPVSMSSGTGSPGAGGWGGASVARSPSRSKLGGLFGGGGGGGGSSILPDEAAAPAGHEIEKRLGAILASSIDGEGGRCTELLEHTQ